MWNYWCISPSSSGKLAFLASWENQEERGRVKMFSIKCDWIGFYKMNCQDKSLSQLHWQEVSVPLQPLWSTAIRVSFELSGAVIVRMCLQCEQKADKCNRTTFRAEQKKKKKKKKEVCGSVQELMKLQIWQPKHEAEQNTAVFSITHTSFNLAEHNTDCRGCLWLFVWPSIFLTRVFFSLM